MAGSYLAVVDEQGRLESNETIASMLENGGDAYEAVEEMYGMIWMLADMTTHSQISTMTPDEAVEYARLNYKVGLARSPGQVEED